jgi:hypothetical protein
VLTEFGSEWGLWDCNTSGWTTFVDAAGASLESTTQPKAGSYSGNLVADFSAGNGGAVDAVVKPMSVQEER